MPTGDGVRGGVPGKEMTSDGEVGVAGRKYGSR